MILPHFHADPLHFVRAGTLVDVGVNVGYHFKKFITVPDCHVIGFEPQRILFNGLCNELNHKFNGQRWPETVEFHNVALSNFVGRTQIRVPVIEGNLEHAVGSIVKDFSAPETAQGYAVSLLTHWVQVTTLDAQKLENVTYLKIDAEGAEQEIIEGGAETIARWKPPINIELEEVHREGCIKAVSELLYAHEYEGFFMFENKLMNFRDFDWNQHQVCMSDGVGAWMRQDGYVFDFQFVHKDDRWSRERMAEIYGNVP